MAFSYLLKIGLGVGQTGLSLRARLWDASDPPVALTALIATGFTELGSGEYTWLYALYPDGFVGRVEVTKADTTYMASAIFNPQDAENLDVKVTTRPAGTDYTQARAVKLDDLDATVSSRLAAADYVLPPTAGVADIQARLPAALTGAGNLKADAQVVSDKTGYTLSAAGVLAVWNQLTADAGIVAASFAKKLKDWALGSDSRALISVDAHASGETVAGVTGLDPSKVDVAVGSRLAAAAYTAPDNADVVAILADVLTLLGRVDVVVSTLAPDNADILAIKADAEILLARSAAIAALRGSGVVGAGATTTSVPTSSLTPVCVTANQYRGRIVIFDAATATAALRGQATDIVSHTIAGVLTVSALTTVPVVGDTFVIV